MPISLIIHGYPREETKGNRIYDFFEKRNWEIIAPYLFTDEFVFTQENAKKYIKEKLGNKKPDVIVGISLGGLVAPHIVKDYPESKLVMIATGPYLKPTSKRFNLTFNLTKNKSIFRAVFAIRKSFPEKILLFLYKIINHPKSKDFNDRRMYWENAEKDIKAFLKISKKKNEEIIDFINKTNNREILSTIKNKTLILTGKKDELMPSELSVKLNKLLINSRLIITEGEHFNVLNNEGLIELANFLN